MGNAPCFQGLAPAPERPKGRITLKYFPIAGRAEPIRLALLLGKFDYEDRRLTNEDWKSEKGKPSAPYRQLPVLIVDGKPLAQTKAILRYIGKLSQVDDHYLYPQDALLAAKVDEVMDAFDDLWILLAPTYRIEDKSQREQARQQLFAPEGEATGLVKIFEQILSKSSNGFVVPEAGLSVADLMYFGFLNVIRSGFVEGLGPDLFKEYPSITKHKDKIANLPDVSAYYNNAEKSSPGKIPHYDVFKPGK